MKEILKDERLGKECFKLEDVSNQLDLSLNDIESLFKDRRLLEDECFFILDPDTGHISTKHGANYKADALLLKEAFQKKQTILIKRLHDLYPKISSHIRELQENATCYLIIAPCGGGSFKWHEDDRHVIIKQVYGEKLIFYKEKGIENVVELKEGDLLTIPQGTLHRALNSHASITLVIGLVTDEDWLLENSITLEDLEREFPNLDRGKYVV